MIWRLFVVIPALSIAAVSAAQTLASDNFEAATVGSQLKTVSGWDSTGDTGLVISSTQARGTKSVQADFSTSGWTSGSKWNWKNISYDPTATSNKRLESEVWIFLGSGHTAGSQLGLDAYDASVSRFAMTRINVQTGDVLLFNGTTTVGTATGKTTLNAWNKLTLVMDFQALTATVKVNDVDAGLSTAITSGTVTDVDLVAFKATGDTGNNVFFDDYKVAAVPEPASVAALGLGVAALLRRRRLSR